MKTLLKTIIACLVIFQATTVFAQQFNTSQMNTSGQSSADTKARYILGLVRNNNVKALDSHFSTQPWDIQANIDVYKDAKQTASVSIFCVAVDLGYVDIVKTFVKYGYGPADLCEVKTYTSQKVIVSKAELFFSNTTNASASSSSSNSSSASSWLSRSGSHSAGGASATASSSTNLEYSQLNFSTKTIVKHYFARPLDFASGEMFDYLFEQGFRSEQLLNKKALAEAKRLGRTEVVDWILSNAQKGDYAPLVDDDTFAMLVQYARQNQDSLAYQALTNGTLKVYKTSTQAKNASKELENKLKDMETNMQIKSPSDTVGYSTMQQQIKAKEAELAKKEAAAAKAKAYQEKINKLRTDDLSKITHGDYRFLANGVCEKGTNPRSVYCSWDGKQNNCNLSNFKYEYGQITYTIHCK